MNAKHSQVASSHNSAPHCYQYSIEEVRPQWESILGRPNQNRLLNKFLCYIQSLALLRYDNSFYGQMVCTLTTQCFIGLVLSISFKPFRYL